MVRSSEEIKQDFLNIVSLRRWHIIGEYVNSKTPIEMECEKGHRWFPTPNTIVNNSSNCLYCARKKRWPGDIQAEAERRGGTYVRYETGSGTRSYVFICHNNHEFSIDVTLFWRGEWCRKCKENENDA